MSSLVDLRNRVFTKLTVLRRATKKEYEKHKLNKKITYWYCKCGCGKKKFISYSNLVKGVSTSCGCRAKELARKRMKKYNDYDLSGEYGIGYDRAGKGEFYFDLEDYEKIKEICWCFQGDGYPTGKVPGTGKYVLLHRWVMGLPEEDVDHENRIKYDCRKENLRIATDEQNAQNRSIPFTNTSGIAGVCRTNLKVNKWRAYLSTKGKQIGLGNFRKFKDAVIARLNAELQYFGLDFAPQRHLFEKYGII